MVWVYQGKQIHRVCVVGAGQTGQSVIRFLAQYHVAISVFDGNGLTDESITAWGQRIHLYAHWSSIDWAQYDLIVVSPGIPINQPPYNLLKQYWSRVIGDIEIFALMADAPIIAVTGSNGKSTTVNALSECLTAAGYTVGLGGNIGVPALNLLSLKSVDYYVLELSSFQIDLLKTARFTIGCLLNIAPDHLDRYPNFQAYQQSKCQLLSHSDWRIVGDSCPVNPQAVDQWIGGKDYFIEKGFLWRDYVQPAVCDLTQLKLVGAHNWQNIAAIVAIMDYLKIHFADYQQMLYTFQGLAHRCEHVLTHNGVDIVNDSKATNVSATKAALVGFLKQSKTVVLLLGGIAKQKDFDDLLDLLNQNVRHVCLYGQDRAKISHYLKGYTAQTQHLTLNEAFEYALSQAHHGDVVLLSPGCSSFDAYDNFAQRGQHFKQLARNKQKSC